MKRTRLLLLGIAAIAAVVFLGQRQRQAHAVTTPPPQLTAVARDAHSIPDRFVDGWHKPVTDGPRAQIAILLDTSGSMQGLINQTRTELWQMVTELTKAQQDGKHPKVELALYAYGISDHAEAGYIRQIAPFTDELDRLSEALFALTTTGSEEYCGQVIQTATNQLDWSRNPDDLKLIFIAGNEPFTQGPVNPIEAVRQASARGITVNTIHCGPQAEGIAGGWQQAAFAACGRFLVVDHNQAVAEVIAPQDAELAQLNGKLNQTYVPYGARGASSAVRQQAQDLNSRNISASNIATRTIAKAGRTSCNGINDDCDGFYDNSGWDLVDATKHKQVDLGKIPDADLPVELRGKDAAERAAWLDGKKQERFAIQERIRQLGAERQKFVAAQRKAGAGTLDQAMIATIHDEAAHVRMSFE